MKRILPNACTAANLFFGMCSILATFAEDYFYASIFILLALIAAGVLSVLSTLIQPAQRILPIPKLKS